MLLLLQVAAQGALPAGCCVAWHNVVSCDAACSRAHTLGRHPGAAQRPAGATQLAKWKRINQTAREVGNCSASPCRWRSGVPVLLNAASRDTSCCATQRGNNMLRTATCASGRAASRGGAPWRSCPHARHHESVFPSSQRGRGTHTAVSNQSIQAPAQKHRTADSYSHPGTGSSAPRTAEQWAAPEGPAALQGRAAPLPPPPPPPQPCPCLWQGAQADLSQVENSNRRGRTRGTRQQQATSGMTTLHSQPP